jgi:glycosyltransferase involved in cell wall biosynthesis
MDDGVVKAVHGLATGMVENGAEVTVLCLGDEDSILSTSHGYTIRCFAAGQMAYKWGLGLPSQLRDYVAANDGIYVMNGVFSPSVYAVSRECSKNSRPFVCWPHEPHHPTLFESRRLAKWVYFRLRDRPMFRAARAIQVFDSTQANYLRKLGVGTPAIEMVNGYDTADALPEPELDWRLKGPARLLFFGSIDAFHKGLDILVDAFAGIVDSTDARLVLQGPDYGDLAALKERVESLGTAHDRVEFREPVYGRSARTIAEHDVFVLPSRFEAFGLAALEAMIAGRVLVLSERSSLAKHVRASGCGVIVSPEKESVRDGLLRLLDERPRWKEMGLAGREYALEHFRWDRIAADVLSHYSQL